MFSRLWLALLLLANYVLVGAMGCLSRPEDGQTFILVKTDVPGQHYQECRYMRMDGLDELLNEALASRYQSAPTTPKHQLISVVHGVDAHHLPALMQWLIAAPFHPASPVPGGGLLLGSPGMVWANYPPPRVG